MRKFTEAEKIAFDANIAKWSHLPCDRCGVVGKGTNLFYFNSNEGERPDQVLCSDCTGEWLTNSPMNLANQVQP